MSEIPGPLSAIGVPIADANAQRRAKPPHEKKLAIIGFAASLLAWCFYLSPDFAQPAWRAPFAASHEEWMAADIWAAVVVIAVVVLMAALAGVRGLRDWTAALWRLALAGTCGALLWWQIYPDADVGEWDASAAFLLKGLYWGWLAAQLARCWACLQLFGLGAEWREKRRAAREARRAEREARERWMAWQASVEDQMSRGSAGDATEQEAGVDLGERGGPRNSLDDQRF
jgi:hypothetical protein